MPLSATLPLIIAVVEMPLPTVKVPVVIVVLPEVRLSTPANCSGWMPLLVMVRLPAPERVPFISRPAPAVTVLVTVMLPFMTTGTLIKILVVPDVLLVTPDAPPPVNAIAEPLPVLMP